MKPLPVFLLLFIVSAFSGAPNRYPTDYFRSPLGIPIRLSGSFGEMRSNHFHSGLDIRTNGKEGYRIYAAADGYVSRISVSPSGFGHALYLSHPNGYTTVSGHLSEFNGDIAPYVKRLQYQEEQFAVQAYPEAGQFPVKKGDVIGYSGNSGSSGGPHLHFEIRDSGTQRPLNPQLFGLPVEDTIAPQLMRVKIYAADASSHAVIRTSNAQETIVTATRPALFEVTAQQGGGYRLAGVRSIEAYGRIGFGIEVRDVHNGSGMRLGAYRLMLTANEQPLYGYEMEMLDFSDQRYLNAHVDYDERQSNRRWLQRSYRLPGNQWPFYMHTDRSGWLEVEPGAEYTLEYRVEDVQGNTSILRYGVTGLDEALPVKPDPIPYTTLVPYNRPHVYTGEGIALTFTAGTVYDDLPLRHETMGSSPSAFSMVHRVHEDRDPLHKAYTLSIAAPDLPVRLRSKAIVVLRDEEGEISSLGGSYQNGFVTTRTRTFGTVFVSADTVAPEIRPLNLSNGKNMQAERSIRIRVEDDLTGLDGYAGYVDDAWVLFEYDPKRDLLEHKFDGRIGSGRHTLRLVVSDGVGNRAAYEASFSR